MRPLRVCSSQRGGVGNMTGEFDIYVLPTDFSIDVINEFIRLWSMGIRHFGEYCIHTESGSDFYCDSLEEFLTQVMSRDDVYSSLYWVKDYDETEKDPRLSSYINSSFIFFNSDGSFILGVGTAYSEDNDPHAILNELNNSFDVDAGFVTLGPPPDSKASFIDVATQSRPPKVLQGVFMEE